MTKTHLKQAFTIPELLITMFIAATFLTAGYQLYSAIIKDSGATRANAAASNVAYEYLRRYSATVSNPCVASNPLVDSSITVNGLSNVKVTVNITCPYTAVTSISEVTVTVKYGASQAQVIYATYVNKT